MSGGVGSSITMAALDRALALVNEANGLLSIIDETRPDTAQIALSVAATAAAADRAAGNQAASTALAEQARQSAIQVSRDAESARIAAIGLDAAMTSAAGSAAQAADSLAAVLGAVSALVGDADAAHGTLGRLAALLAAHASDPSNPHGVTALQVGAYSRDQVDQVVGSAISALRSGLKAADLHDGSTDGLSLVTAPNMGAIRVLLSLVIGQTVQAWDGDLDAIAALTTTPFGRSLLTGADAPGLRTMLGLGSAAVLGSAVPGGAATLDSSTGKLLASQVPDALLGAVRFQTFWNASTNSPALPAAAAANKGFYYIVTTAGTTALAGPSGSITDWQVGDWAISDGTYWGKVDSSDQVISVAGLQGVITAAGLKAALGVALADITDASVNGRSLVSAANYAAMRTLLGLVVGTDVQAYNAGLAAIAALSTAAFGRSLLTATDAAAVKTALAIVAGDIGDASANGRSLIKAVDYSAMRLLLGLVVGTNVQAWDADLDAIAAIGTQPFGRSLLAQTDQSSLLANIGADSRYLRFDASQALSQTQKSIARTNIGADAVPFMATSAGLSDFTSNGSYFQAASVDFVANRSGVFAVSSAIFNHQATQSTQVLAYLDCYDVAAASLVSAGPAINAIFASGTTPILSLNAAYAFSGLGLGRTYRMRLWVQRVTAAGPTAITSPSIMGINA